MTTCLADDRKSKHGRHTDGLTELALDRGELEERFADYRSRYGIRTEEPVA